MRQAQITLVVGVVVLAMFALSGVLLVAPGPESQFRLGLLFGVIGTGIASLRSMVRADQAADNTNGKLDDRVQAAVHRANNARRRGDPPMTKREIDEE